MANPFQNYLSIIFVAAGLILTLFTLWVRIRDTQAKELLLANECLDLLFSYCNEFQRSLREQNQKSPKQIYAICNTLKPKFFKFTTKFATTNKTILKKHHRQAFNHLANISLIIDQILKIIDPDDKTSFPESLEDCISALCADLANLDILLKS